MSTTKYLVIFVLSALYYTGSINISYEEYERRKKLIKSIHEERLSLEHKIKLSLISVFDEHRLRAWKQNLPFSGPCSYLNVRNSSNVIAVWGDVNDKMLNSGFQLVDSGGIEILEKYYDQINPGEFNCDVEVSNINREWSSLWVNIKKRAPGSGKLKSFHSSVFKAMNRRGGLKRKEEGSSSDSVSSDPIGEEAFIFCEGTPKEKHINRLKTVISSGVPVLEPDYVKIGKENYFFHCCDLKTLFERAKGKSLITVLKRPEESLNKEFFVGCPAPALYLFKTIWSLISVTLNMTEKIHLKKKMIYLKEENIIRSGPKKQGEELSPCDWVNSEFRMSREGEKVLISTNTRMASLGDLKNMREIDLNHHKHSTKGEMKFNFKECRLVFTTHVSKSGKINVQMSWYDKNRNVLIEQVEKKMAYPDYNKMMNLFRLINKNELSGFVSRTYTILKENTVHFKSPTRILNDFSAGSKEAFFVAEIGKRSFVGSAEVVLSPEIGAMNKLSSCFDEQTLKLLVLHNCLFFGKLDLDLMFSFIPGTFIKKTDTPLTSCKFKRYSSDISRIFAICGYKPLYKLILFPKTPSLINAERMAQEYSIKIGETFKVVDKNGLVLFEAPESIEDSIGNFSIEAEKLLDLSKKEEDKEGARGKMKKIVPNDIGEIFGKVEKEFVSTLTELKERVVNLNNSIPNLPMVKNPRIGRLESIIEAKKKELEEAEIKFKSKNNEFQLTLERKTLPLMNTKDEYKIEQIKSSLSKRFFMKKKNLELKENLELSKSNLKDSEDELCKLLKNGGEFLFKEKTAEINELLRLASDSIGTVTWINLNKESWIKGKFLHLEKNYRAFLEMESLQVRGLDPSFKTLTNKEILNNCYIEINERFNNFKKKTIDNRVSKILKKCDNKRDQKTNDIVSKISSKSNLVRERIYKDSIKVEKDAKGIKRIGVEKTPQIVQGVRRKSRKNQRNKEVRNFNTIFRNPREILGCLLLGVRKGIFLSENKLGKVSNANLKYDKGVFFNRELKNLCKFLFDRLKNRGNDSSIAEGGSLKEQRKGFNKNDKGKRAAKDSSESVFLDKLVDFVNNDFLKRDDGAAIMGEMIKVQSEFRELIREVNMNTA